LIPPHRLEELVLKGYFEIAGINGKISLSKKGENLLKETINLPD